MAYTSRTLTVGAGSSNQYHTISSAIAASQNGDTLAVSAGTYTNDTAIISTSVHLEAVGGRVLMNETAAVPNEKGILVVGTSVAAPTVTIDGFDFSGARTPNGNNGAGVRYQNGSLTLTNDYFHNNQDGVLATPWHPGTGSVSIGHSEFAANGTGDGYTHNIYIGDIGSFSLTSSYSHDAIAGHEVKSRAENNTITGNRIFDNAGTASYSVDLPNGGNAVISQNTIEQGAHSQNPAIIAYGEEGALHAGRTFQVSGNTIVNDLSSVSTSGVWNRGAGSAALSGNHLFGIPAAKVLVGAGTLASDTVLAARPSLDTTTHPYGTAPAPALAPVQAAPAVMASAPSAGAGMTASFDPATHKVHVTGQAVNTSPILVYGAADGRAVGPGTGTGITTIQPTSASFSAYITANPTSSYAVETVEGAAVARDTLRTGAGAMTFGLHQADAVQDVLSGFRVGQDHVHVTGAGGVVLSAAQDAALISGATSSASGSAVLHLAANHPVTLSGVAVSHLSVGVFG